MRTSKPGRLRVWRVGRTPTEGPTLPTNQFEGYNTEWPFHPPPPDISVLGDRVCIAVRSVVEGRGNVLILRPLEDVSDEASVAEVPTVTKGTFLHSTDWETQQLLGRLVGRTA